MIVTLAVTSARAQLRMSCTPSHPQETRTRGSYHMLPEPITNWDAQRTYRQPVVLVTFKDFDFSMSDPASYYNRILNEHGYNEGMGKGSVADYFREQSGGLFNLKFDVYGPFQVDTTATSSKYGSYVMKNALAQLRATTDADFSVYDWTGDGEVNQMIFIVAGYTGNEKSGYIWPSTSSCYDKAPGNLPIVMTSISCEKWANDKLCGIGTICHEFAHCLGLPDIYPTTISLFSVVDEWDLMDGGNYTNYGWCPPNFSTMEKLFLGWTTPTELTSATTITGMKPVSEGGETYIIRNSGNENEFYLLENRRQTGWDYGTPGNGLLIFHVDYDYDKWLNNDVNISASHFRYDLFHADNKDYMIWDPNNNGKDPNKWTNADERLRNRYLSTSPYPYTEPVSLNVNQELTDESVPASTLFKTTAEGTNFMSKPITNIKIASDGTVSFDFMKKATGIQDMLQESQGEVWYDLHGRQLPEPPRQSGIYIIRQQNGKTKKIIQ